MGDEGEKERAAYLNLNLQRQSPKKATTSLDCLHNTINLSLTSPFYLLISTIDPESLVQSLCV
jgi:hypothetical protein